MDGGKISLPAQIAVIDIGAHSIRMEICQLQPDKSYQTLEKLTLPVTLGKDVFSRGVISPETIEATCSILNDFVMKMAEYGVSYHQAFATSAVREASNGEIFLNRVKIASGIQIEILEASKETELLSLSVKHALSGRYPISKCDCLLLALGTGSAEICFFHNGLLKSAEILAMGTIRLSEEFGTEAISNKRITEIIDSYTGWQLQDVCRQQPPPENFLFVATGAGVRTLMDVYKKNRDEQIRSISREKFEKLFLKLHNLPPDEITARYGIDDTAARSVVPAAWIIKHAFDITGAESLVVPSITTRTAMIEGMIRSIFNEQDQFLPDIISAVNAIGEKYRYDAERTRNITALALRIFDKLEHVHGMGQRERLFLQCAAILHDIGRFVDCRKHHKHSYYLISNTQLPGFLDIERNTIATIARYHRRTRPKASHPEYMALPPQKRVIVCKAAAILRVADALDRSHRRDPNELKMSLKDHCLTVRMQDYADISLEKCVLEKRVDLFTEVFGLRVVLE